MSQVDESIEQGEQQPDRSAPVHAGAQPMQARKGWHTKLAILREPRTQGWLVSLIVFGVAMAFDTYQLGKPSIWFDEAFSVELAKQPLPLLWHIIWGPEPNMELYYLFLHGWLGLTGFFGWLPTEVVVRLPSAIFAALSSVVVFLLGKRFLGMAAGIAGAGLYSLNFLQLVYAQQTRAYSLQLLLICIAWYALFALLATRGQSRRWWICFILATTLAIYMHLFSVLILTAQVITFAGLLILPGPWRDGARHRWRGFIMSLAAIGILSIPMGLVSLHGSKTNWLPIPHLSDITHLFVYIAANNSLYLMLLFLGCICAVGVALLTLSPEGMSALRPITFAAREDEQGESRLKQYFPVAFALVCWLFIPIIVSYVVSQGSTRLFSTRYLVTILPPLFLLVGMAIAALRWRLVQVGLIAGMLLIALHYAPVYYASAQVEDWNTAVPWLEQHYQPGDGMVCFVQPDCQIAVQYYLDAYPSAAHFTPNAPEAFSWENFDRPNPTSGSSSAVDTKALATYAAQYPRFFYILGRYPDNATAARAMAAQNWLDSHYHLLGRIHTTTVTISLYATGP